MIERTITPRPWRWGRRAGEIAVITVAASLAIDPAAIPRRADSLLVHARRALGEILLRRELAALAGMLEADRGDLSRAEALRNALEVRLESLQIRRRMQGIEDVPTRYDNDHQEASPLTGQTDVDLDGAIAELRSTIELADRYLDSARRIVRVRETDLCALEVLAESQRARRELTELDRGLPRWDGRAMLAAELIGSPPRTAE